MTWHLSYRPEVEDDLVDAALWYDDKQPGLGEEFITEFLAAIRRIRDNSMLYAVAPNGLRPCRLRRFSYIIHFDVDGSDILIVAVMGGGRDDSAFIHRASQLFNLHRMYDGSPKPSIVRYCNKDGQRRARRPIVQVLHFEQLTGPAFIHRSE